ncbi:hypothetical protein [Bordetella genomosp. 11]|uniref:Lipoprotein n=1 Tax=Bordetella genomosp. 11 TaxID=1416808 RepID=A0A261UHI1_9BORD|nr:hypothetical protein [Bordetella genomosp. 11]OZI60680.1 hypothetical protein CAL28_14900 [Bordetella genomosp. 11]
MKTLIRFVASACLFAALVACSSTPSMSDLDSADYGPRPTDAQVAEGIRALGGNAAAARAASGGESGYRLSTGWATDLDNPGSYIYGWQVRFQQDASQGGGTVTALFHDGVLIAATRETASQAAPVRLK